MKIPLSQHIFFLLLSIFIISSQTAFADNKSSLEKPDILFYADFDISLNGSIAKGEKQASVNTTISITSKKEGKFGEGVIIKAGDVLKYKTVQNLSNTNGTFSIWFKPEFTLPDEYFGGYIPYYLFSVIGSDWGNRMDFRAGKALNYIIRKDLGQMQECHWTVLRALWQSSDWHLATITWNSTVIQMYFDGELKDSLYHDGLPSNFKGYFNIGSDQNGKSQFIGALDDAVILNAPLTANEIKQYYSSGKPFPEFWNQWVETEKSLSGSTTSSITLTSLVNDHVVKGVRIFTRMDGIYKITYEQLKENAYPVEKIIPKNLIITNQGNTVPINVHTKDPNQFQSGDWVEFGASPFLNEYQNENTYILTWLPENIGKTKRYKTIDYAIQSIQDKSISRFNNRLHLEENYIYKDFQYRSDTATDTWFWLDLTAPAKQEIQFNLPNLSEDTTLLANIKLCFQGYSYPAITPNHHVKVKLNGHDISDIWWEGRKEIIYENSTISLAYLNKGKNTLSFTAPGDIDPKKKLSNPIDASYLNWVEIRYWQPFEIQNDALEFSLSSSERENTLINFTNSQKTSFRLFDLTNGVITQFPAKTNIQGNNLQSSYFYSVKGDVNQQITQIIALSDNIPIQNPKKIEPMWNFNLHNPNQGADYLIITHRDFYEAIKPLVEYREKHGLKAIIVTVDSIYDEFNSGFMHPNAIRDFIKYTQEKWKKSPRYILLVGDASFDYLNNSRKNVTCFIPCYDWYRSNSYRTGRDNWYIDEYTNDSSKPLISIGRFPVRTPEETSRIVKKIIAYEGNKSDSEWKHNILMIGGIEQMFHENSDELIKKLPKDFTSHKLYVEDNSVTRAIDTVKRERVLNELNEGRVMVHFTGHGGGGIWADKELFLLEDIKKLTNDNKLPAIFSLTCYSADFDSPYMNCLGEEMLRSNTGGAIAFYGASGLSMAYDNFAFSRALFDVIFKEKTNILGDIIQKTRRKLKYENHMNLENADVYNLLGDPALQIQFPAFSYEVFSKDSVI